MTLAIYFVSLGVAIALAYILLEVGMPDPKMQLLGKLMRHSSPKRAKRKHVHA